MPRVFVYRRGDAKSHAEFGRKLQGLAEGDYVIEIKKKRNIRSLSANKYYHVILNIIGIETGHTHEELHEAMKMKFNSKMIFFPKGGSQSVGQTTSNLDSAEFHAYLNRVKNWALNEFGIVIPEREEVTQDREMDIENTYEENQHG